MVSKGISPFNLICSIDNKYLMLRRQILNNNWSVIGEWRTKLSL